MWLNCKEFGVNAAGIKVDLSDQEQTYDMIVTAEKAIGKTIQDAG